MAVNQLIPVIAALGWVAMRTHNQHPLKAGFPHRLHEFVHIRSAERPPGLVRTIVNHAIVKLVNGLTRLGMWF
jgi:hypothetical protein